VISLGANKNGPQNSATVNVGCVGLKTLVVSKNLTSWSSWHWSNQKWVSNSIPRYQLL